ncbi:glycosyltransferase family 4 protein [Pseudobutyrivibrio sp. MD2005]|uniref:glycosyltransferase family 4 protein n=1 Tax=Pseudobutyrivibrio sp. MD2005 TaxID=1410616 RepID=UPI000481F761|nr:glycosyltransferase family 4 protein [Pseudobutyrivibrio sp. MD2005]
MKCVALVHHTGELGGGTKSLIDMANMLCERYEVIICVPKGRLLEVEFNKDNIRVKEISVVPHLNLFSGASPIISKASLTSIKSLFGIKRFCDEINEVEPDLIVFNSIVCSVAVIGGLNTKCAVIDRETLTNKFQIRLYRNLLEKMSGVAFLCEYERKKLDINSGRKVVVLPDCVPQEDLCVDNVLKKHGKPDGIMKVLYMGGSSRLKGAEIALEAMTKVNDKVRLIVAGRFEVRRFSLKNILIHLYNPIYCRHLIRLRKAYRKTIVLNNIEFVGQQKNIYPLIDDCDLVIFPSTKVHQPRPCIEAGYFKKPVIISDFHETREYFIEGYNALTFRPNDSYDLADCIEYAYNHKEVMILLGENNYLMSRKYHDYEIIKKEFNGFIDGMVY